jgi:hypothetical protein
MTDHHDYRGHVANKPGVNLHNELIVTFGLLVAIVLFILGAMFLVLAITERTVTLDVLIEGFKILGISMAVAFSALIYNRFCRY